VLEGGAELIVGGVMKLAGADKAVAAVGDGIEKTKDFARDQIKKFVNALAKPAMGLIQKIMEAEPGAGKPIITPVIEDGVKVWVQEGADGNPEVWVGMSPGHKAEPSDEVTKLIAKTDKLRGKLAKVDAKTARESAEARRLESAIAKQTKASKTAIIPKEKFDAYLDEVGRLADSRPIGDAQRRLLEEHRKSVKHGYLGPTLTKYKRGVFGTSKDDLIDEWEQQTGRKWPKYRKDVPAINPQAKAPNRRAGNRYDAHEIIPNSYGGPQEWWNIHPAYSPDEHQAGIHASGRLFKELFPLAEE
jgi:hypothetical protein